MIPLGSKVKDTITGLTGIVTGFHRYDNGTEAVAVQPQVIKDGRPVEPYSVEVPQAKVLRKAPGPEKPWSGPNFGDEVRDKITGFSGVVVGHAQWLHGCERVAVQPKELKDGIPVKSVWLDVAHAEIVKPAKAEPVKRAGGPMPMPERR